MAPNIPVEIRKQIASQLEAQEAEIKVLEAVLKMQKIKTAYLSEVDNEPELPFEKRLRELCVLQPGWYDGKHGEKVSLTSVNNSRILLARLHQDKPSLVPSISPSIEGEILLSYKGISIQVEDTGTVVLLHQGKADELDFNTHFEHLIITNLDEAK